MKIGMSDSVCSVCKRRSAVFTDRVSGISLCGPCFIKGFERRVQRTISKYDMFREDDRIAVAVSGGKDSNVLLYVLNKIEQNFPKSEVIAITVDEGISGYRDVCIKFATRLSKKLGVEHVMVSFKEMFGISLDEVVDLCRKIGVRPCTVCGVLRRKALNVTARELGADKLATAHNLDDEVETIFMNVIKGDFERLFRVKRVQEKTHEKFVPRVKPLCEISSREIILYAQLRGIEYYPEPCPYRGDVLRGEVRRILNDLERRIPSVKYSILRFHDRLLRMADSLGWEPGEQPVRECEICGEPSSGSICKACELLRRMGVLS